MTTTAAKPGFDAETDRLLAGLGVARDRYTGGTLKARSPIDGSHARPPAGDTRRTRPPPASAARQAAFQLWRDVPAPRRGELVRLLGEELRAAKDALGRLVSIEAGKILPGGPRRGAGDDRHLRLRRRPVAPALRPDHRLGAARPPHDGDLAPAGRRRRHHRLQLPGRGLGVERGAGPGLRQPRGLEALGEDAAHRARLQAPLRARRSAGSATRPTACRRS